MKILIAEDDTVSRRLLRGHLEKWGHAVTEAKDGSEAWDLFLRDDFPIVIVDWMMPLMDGLELIQRVRARQLPRYTYLLMLTAKNQKQDVVTGMDAGADDYLTKPFDKEELRARLQAGQRILDLQAALMLSEKSASVGRLAVGVANEIAGPVAEVLQSLIDLRSDTHALIDLATPPTAPLTLDPAHDPDAPPPPRRAPVDPELLRNTLGPKFYAAEKKLHDVRDLVRALRDFARLDDLPTRPLSLATLVTDTLSMMRQELTAKQLHVTWSPPQGTPPVTGNPGKLKRALYNLLCVLVETTADGNTISLKLTSDPPTRTLTLDLTGGPPGIPADRIDHLFEPFARTGLTSGLGLPIAFSILREHGATLDASATSTNTTFRARIPVAG